MPMCTLVRFLAAKTGPKTESHLPISLGRANSPRLLGSETPPTPSCCGRDSNSQGTPAVAIPFNQPGVSQLTAFLSAAILTLGFVNSVIGEKFSLRRIDLRIRHGRSILPSAAFWWQCPHMSMDGLF